MWQVVISEQLCEELWLAGLTISVFNFALPVWLTVVVRSLQTYDCYKTCTLCISVKGYSSNCCHCRGLIKLKESLMPILLLIYFHGYSVHWLITKQIVAKRFEGLRYLCKSAWCGLVTLCWMGLWVPQNWCYFPHFQFFCSVSTEQS